MNVLTAPPVSGSGSLEEQARDAASAQETAMPINSSSFLNVTITPPPHPSSNSLFYIECLESIASSVIFSIYTFTNVLFIPLYILILYMGFQQWSRQRSRPAGQSTSHSDFFTFHTVTMEIIGVLGSFFYTLGIYTKSFTALTLGLYVSCVTFPGQTLFHLLTCVERYLAVVHPITYMRLRERGGVRIRNISIACVWLACCVWFGVTKLYLPSFAALPLLCMLAVSLILTSFFCLSVLCALTHSGPGEVGGEKKGRVDQSKRRSFYIICAIMGVLLLRFAGLLVTFALSFQSSIPLVDLCAWIDLGIFLSIPSSLVLPLLFLHKSGKLACCRHDTESG